MKTAAKKRTRNRPTMAAHRALAARYAEQSEYVTKLEDENEAMQKEIAGGGTLRVVETFDIETGIEIDQKFGDTAVGKVDMARTLGCEIVLVPDTAPERHGQQKLVARRMV